MFLLTLDIVRETMVNYGYLFNGKMRTTFLLNTVVEISLDFTEVNQMNF